MADGGLRELQREIAERQRAWDEREKSKQRALRRRDAIDFLAMFVLPAAVACVLTAIVDAAMKSSDGSGDPQFRWMLMAFAATAGAAGGLRYWTTRPYVKNGPDTPLEHAGMTLFMGMYVYGAAWVLWWIGAAAINAIGRLFG